MNYYNHVKQIALNEINYIEYHIEEVKESIKAMKAQLGKAGYRVEFNYEGQEVFCSVFAKNKPKSCTVAQAKCSNDDVYIKELGEYLALARATDVILGDNKEGE